RSFPMALSCQLAVGATFGCSHIATPLPAFAESIFRSSTLSASIFIPGKSILPSHAWLQASFLVSEPTRACKECGPNCGGCYRNSSFPHCHKHMGVVCTRPYAK